LSGSCFSRPTLPLSVRQPGREPWRRLVQSDRLPDDFRNSASSNELTQNTASGIFLQQNFSPFASGRAMKNFSDAAFSPEVIEIMTVALEESINTLPHPVSTAHVNLLAESILRTANAGERDVAVLKRIALVELQITPRS
jgi:hypothetical protein